MFTAQRNYLNFLTIANPTDLSSRISDHTLVAGDVILFRFSTHVYGKVNAAGTGIDLATA